jgi:DNA-binding ferritin-like protein (Dps family)
MNIKAVIEGKKEWRAHVSRVKALPQDYQIVYQEIQTYLFKVASFEQNEGIELLLEIVRVFEEGAAAGKGVLEVTGTDIAAFCDDRVNDAKS